MIPEIELRYSKVYDDRYRNNAKNKEEYPAQDKVFDYTQKITEEWNKYSHKICSLIAEIHGLDWKENQIIVYIVGLTRCFSDPMTLKMFDNNERFIDTLTHELIHRIRTKNGPKYKKWDKYLEEKYKNEAPMTKAHILTHAIHKKIILEMFDKNRLDREVESTTNPEYIKAWKIVEEEGYENIIFKFKELMYNQNI